MKKEMELVSLPVSLHALQHNLRTPLTGILGNAYLLKDNILTPEQQDLLADIFEAGNQLLEFINLLTTEIKRIESNDLDLKTINKIN